MWVLCAWVCARGVQESSAVRRAHWIPLHWSYWHLWAAQIGSLEKDSGPLEEKQVLKTVEPFPQHTLVYLFIQDAVTHMPGAVASFG